MSVMLFWFMRNIFRILWTSVRLGIAASWFSSSAMEARRLQPEKYPACKCDKLVSLKTNSSRLLLTGLILGACSSLACTTDNIVRLSNPRKAQSPKVFCVGAYILSTWNYYHLIGIVNFRFWPDHNFNTHFYFIIANIIKTMTGMSLICLYMVILDKFVGRSKVFEES